MKADETRTPLPVKHEHEHEVPTVLHHTDDDLPLLARWLERAMENRTRFWGLVTAVVLAAVGLSVLSSGLTLGRASSDQAWTRLETAKTPGERVELAKEFPKTQAERWALLQAATEYYNQGFNDLPANRDAALPPLKKALDLFERVAAEAPHDSPQARAAALGVARTLEARNELDKAARQYEKVAATKSWAGTDEARTADRLARALRSPEAVAFYKDLYAYKPAEATLPPGGVGDLGFPMPANHPPLSGTGGVPIPGLTSPANEPSLRDVPPPPPTPAPKSETKGSPAGGLPANLFAPPAPGGTPKADAPAPKKAGLPDDVFAPK